MKSNKNSNKNFKRSDFEKNDMDAQFGKGSKKDRGTKRRLSIYDEFDEEEFDYLNYRHKDEDSFDEEEE